MLRNPEPSWLTIMQLTVGAIVIVGLVWVIKTYPIGRLATEGNVVSEQVPVPCIKPAPKIIVTYAAYIPGKIDRADDPSTHWRECKGECID